MSPYAARFRKDPETEDVTVTFRDVPEAITQGDNRDDAVLQAEDALAQALLLYIEKGLSIPETSAPRRGDVLIFLPTLIQAKLHLWHRMVALGLNKTQLAARLGMPESGVRRMLRLDHQSKVSKVEAALAALNCRLRVETV